MLKMNNYIPFEWEERLLGYNEEKLAFDTSTKRIEQKEIELGRPLNIYEYVHFIITK